MGEIIATEAFAFQLDKGSRPHHRDSRFLVQGASRNLLRKDDQLLRLPACSGAAKDHVFVMFTVDLNSDELTVSVGESPYMIAFQLSVLAKFQRPVARWVAGKNGNIVVPLTDARLRMNDNGVLVLKLTLRMRSFDDYFAMQRPLMLKHKYRTTGGSPSLSNRSLSSAAGGDAVFDYGYAPLGVNTGVGVATSEMPETFHHDNSMAMDPFYNNGFIITSGPPPGFEDIPIGCYGMPFQASGYEESADVPVVRYEDALAARTKRSVDSSLNYPKDVFNSRLFWLFSGFMLALCIRYLCNLLYALIPW